VTEKEVLSDYLAHVMKAADGVEHLKVIVDYGNGVGAISAKPALARLDLAVTSLFEDPDGNFPNHPANPHDTINFKNLTQKVLADKADLGIFFDGDADRAVFVDDLGRIVPTDLLFILLAKKQLENDKNKGQNFYYDLRFTKSTPDLIQEYGGNPVMMAVGNPLYKRALKEKGGALAAEYSGHIMFPENYNLDDGLYAVLVTIGIISASGSKLSTLIDEVKIYQTSEEQSIEAACPDNLFERLKKAFPDGKEIKLDGLYLDFPDGFISVRQSQNEPQLFRIRVEGKSIYQMQERLEGVRKIVSSTDS
jgi:phosphomannomutase